MGKRHNKKSKLFEYSYRANLNHQMTTGKSSVKFFTQLPEDYYSIYYLEIDITDKEACIYRQMGLFDGQVGILNKCFGPGLVKFDCWEIEQTQEYQELSAKYDTLEAFL